jgi:4-carboxymuconolactone decarboxylase
MLIALKSWPEVGVHVRGAINNGLTELEIREAILQSAIYCGAPAGLEAMKVASAVLEDMAAKGEYVPTLINKEEKLN